MQFHEAFLRTLAYRPGAALAALYWRVTRRRVRARNVLRAAAADAPYVYNYWIGAIERQDEILRAAAATMSGWARRPRISIVLAIGEGASADAIAASIRAVEEQCYPDWELLLAPVGTKHHIPAQLPPGVRVIDVISATEGEALSAGIDGASGDFVMPLAAGTQISPTGLYRLAEAIVAEPEGDVFFGDHDERDDRGRRAQPWLKPQWNLEQFLSQDYVSQACAVRADLARAVASDVAFADDAAAFALVLHAASATGVRVVRVPHIVAHLHDSLGPRNQAARMRVVRAYLEGAGAQILAGEFGSVRVQWPLPADPPLVSIIVPTRDKFELLRTCISSVLAAQGYPAFEIIVVDNGSTEPATLDYLREIECSNAVRVLRYDAPFNYSAINNFAVEQARGDYICLLNNDTEVISDDWLAELMRQAVRDHVGAVGARLLYADGSIQHAGVIPGIGEAAGHAHRDLPAGEPGYFHQVYVARYATAVTAACLVVEKRKFEAVGGLDEEAFQVAFNDVDLCLKLARAGWQNLYTPYAMLYHYESKSRGKDSDRRNIERYRRELAELQARWATRRFHDPQHHPALDRYNEKFVLRLEPEREPQ